MGLSTSHDCGPRDVVNTLQFEVIAVVDATTDFRMQPDRRQA
jgi:hypothetical protein